MKIEKPVCSVMMKIDKPVCAVAMKIEKPLCASAIKIDEPDVYASFDATEKAWTVTCEAELPSIPSRLQCSARLSYEADIGEWRITNECLEPYGDHKLGPAKGFILLMAIVQ